VSWERAVAAARHAALARPSLPPELSAALAGLTGAVLEQALAAHDAAPELTEPRYRPLVAEWRALARQYKQSGLFVSAAQPVAADAVGGALDTVAGIVPDELVAYLRLAAESLVDVLRGEVAPLEPYLAAEAPRFLYDRSSVARWMNGILAAAAAEVAGPYLEVGAGSGGTTAAVLAALPAEARYDVTDASTTFFPRLARRLGPRAGVRFFALDVEQPPQAPVATYGTVIAANVLHATRDLRVTLAGLRARLAPGGVLLLWEATRAEPWYAFTFALIDGWRRHADGLRGDGPLLGGAAWLRLLAAAGWGEAVAIPDDDALGQQVFIAR
jgi:SAM-dependent methyltransferase